MRFISRAPVSSNRCDGSSEPGSRHVGKPMRRWAEPFGDLGGSPMLARAERGWLLDAGRGCCHHHRHLICVKRER